MIQLALDTLDIPQTLKLASLTAPYVDIFEIGTQHQAQRHRPGEGVQKRFPNKLLLVDLKTMDAGEYEATPSSPPPRRHHHRPRRRRTGHHQGASSTPPTSTTPRSRST
ncbi:orotidine 5'-phosphate decarboxylase / HUMPS family protein [Methylococcus capsulatus]|uniref:orotidine 5'-phosphate decarboxylase / HUMPS family protein n=1 Tax=Methylococcus capsulatus TaxID=414 RepID=UPI00211B6BD7